MSTTVVTEWGWDGAVEPTRDGRIELLIARDEGKGGRLFFDRFNAGLLADAIAQSIEDGPPETVRHVMAEAAGVRGSTNIVSQEGWRAAVCLDARSMLEIGLAAADGCVALVLQFNPPNADLLLEGLRRGIGVPAR
jgi:hypothetical protein